LLKLAYRVKMQRRELTRQALEALLACLKDVPFVENIEATSEATEDSSVARPDGVVRLKLPDGEQLLLLEVKPSGQPRLAREATNQLYRYRQAYLDAYGVVAAPYVSPRAAAICREAGVGYVDLAGNCHLSFNHVYIQRQGQPNPFAQKRDLRSLYSPRAERVLRVLLTHPGRAWKLQALADEAGVSLGHAHNVKNLLMDREWLRREAGGFMSSAPADLLGEWAANYDDERNRQQAYYSLQEPHQVEADLVQVCRQEGIRCALTGFSAAARLAPFVRYQRASAYVMSEPGRLADRLGLKPVLTGANLVLLTPYDEGVWYGVRQVDGACVVSPIQAYLDLQALSGRGQEAAHYLFEQVIQPTW
jgi:hypothetical protein